MKLKDVTLKSWIVCAVDGDYSTIGGESVWFALWGEYHSISGDEKVKRKVEIVGQMEAIRLRANIIDFLVECLIHQYHVKIAGLLREEYGKYSLKFTPETYIEDIGHIKTIEKHNVLIFDRLKDEYDAIEKANDGKSDKHKAGRLQWINMMLDINQHEGAYYTEDTMSMETFALCVKRLEAHKEHLQRQNKKK